MDFKKNKHLLRVSQEPVNWQKPRMMIKNFLPPLKILLRNQKRSSLTKLNLFQRKGDLKVTTSLLLQPLSTGYLFKNHKLILWKIQILAMEESSMSIPHTAFYQETITTFLMKSSRLFKNPKANLVEELISASWSMRTQCTFQQVKD